MQAWDVIVIGAGASGLFFAARAARAGRRVAVLDAGTRPARKVRISGGGRCNFTNLDAGPEHYQCGNPHFTRSALARFSPWDAVGWLAEHGLGYEEKAAGQLFCEQGAGSVARALEADCADAGVDLVLNTPVRGAEPEGDGFAVHAETGETLRAERLVVATGGPSWPGVGASGLGYDIAKRFGLRVEPVRPALVPLVCGNWRHADLAGLAVPARIACGGAAFADDMLFTHKGLSGPAVLQASTFWTRGEDLVVDLLPGEQALALLTAAKHEKGTGKTLVRNFLARHLPARLAAALPGRLADAPLAECRADDLERLAATLNTWRVTPTRTEGWDKAEVAAGGVDTANISSKTMAAADTPRLHFLGEVLDVTGQLGGYNLHWAWASAHAAAEGV